MIIQFYSYVQHGKPHQSSLYNNNNNNNYNRIYIWPWFREDTEALEWYCHMNVVLNNSDFKCFFKGDNELLKPNAQRETELNWIQLNSTVQFSSVSRCALNQRRFADEIGGRRRFFTIGTHLWISQSVVGRKPATSCDDGRRPSQVCRRPSPVVAAHRSSSPV